MDQENPYKPPSLEVRHLETRWLTLASRSSFLLGIAISIVAGLCIFALILNRIVWGYLGEFPGQRIAGCVLYVVLAYCLLVVSQSIRSRNFRRMRYVGIGGLSIIAVLTTALGGWWTAWWALGSVVSYFFGESTWMQVA